MTHSAEYLANLYERLGSLQNDSRNFNLLRWTGADLDRVTGSFDAIKIIDVLEHIEDDREQLRQPFTVEFRHAASFLEFQDGSLPLRSMVQE